MRTVITPHNTKTIQLKELWEFRELLCFLIWRDIKVRYKQTTFGILWAVLQPFLAMIVFTIFFNKVLGITSGNIPYPVFAFTGLVFWNYFSSALSDTSNSLINNQSIITKVFFPRIIIPISTTVVPIIDFFFAFLFLLILLPIFHIHLSILGILSAILGLFITVVTVIGLGNFLAILNVKYRDVRYALPFFIQLLLFVTPVIYSVHTVPLKFQLFLYINPLTGVIDLIRVVMLHQYSINIMGSVISLISDIVLLVIGAKFFMQYESGIVDTL